MARAGVCTGASDSMVTKKCDEKDETVKLEKQLSAMIDEFCDKYGEKALNPKDFPEVARELKELKRRIKEAADNTPIEKEVFSFHISQKADLFSDITTANIPLLKRIERVVVRQPYEDFGVPLQMAKDIKNMLCNHVIIMDALTGGGEKPAKDQIKHFLYIARVWNKHY